MGSKSVSFLLARTVIVLFCVLLISGFLYSPYLIKLFNVKEHLTVYTWADMFDLNDVSEFEKQTNTKIKLVYYDNCEELVTKLEISQGRGYDLLLLADCNICDLIKMDLLAPIDKNKFNFWQDIKPELLNRSYDPENIYSVPYSWDVYGIGVNIEKFKNQVPDNSWNLVFDQKVALPKIGMMEDGLSSVAIAAQYLYGNAQTIDSSKLANIKQLLTSQKEIVEVYTAIRGDYLLSSGASPAVVSQAACVYRAMANDDKIKFLVPKEGGFISTENFVILKTSTKQSLAYQFINFMSQKELVKKYVDRTMFLPARQDVLQEMNLDYLGGHDNILNDANFKKIAYFKYVVPRQEITKLWIEVKAS